MVLVEQICRKLFKVNIMNAENSFRNIIKHTLYPDWKLGVQFVDLDHIKELNVTYRNINRPTDILSFPFHEPISPGVLPDVRKMFSDESLVEEMKNFGDLYLCLPYIQNMCQQYNISLEERLPILFVHGICHLMGYDHETDKDYEVMSKVENKLITAYWSWRKELEKTQDMTHLEPLEFPL